MEEIRCREYDKKTYDGYIAALLDFIVGVAEMEDDLMKKILEKGELEEEEKGGKRK